MSCVMVVGPGRGVTRPASGPRRPGVFRSPTPAVVLRRGTPGPAKRLSARTGPYPARFRACRDYRSLLILRRAWPGGRHADHRLLVLRDARSHDMVVGPYSALSGPLPSLQLLGVPHPALGPAGRAASLEAMSLQWAGLYPL